MKDFFTCNAFSKEFEIKNKFSIFQDHLHPVKQYELKPVNTEFKCQWYQKTINKKKPFVVIPIRNCSNLLEYTLENFYKNNMFEHANVIVVDDRSDEDLKTIVDKYPVSFLKTEYNVNFNFSMLNNIAALLSYSLGGDTLILWNSDLWIDKIEHFTKLLKMHKQEGSTISGSKLLYPNESFHKEEHSDNIKKHFPTKLDGSYKGTIQFGGARWVPVTIPTKAGNINTFHPHHFKRFADKKDHRVNCNYATEFVTGALQVIDLKWYIECGGLNPSLPKILQDTDICLRALTDNRKVMYFGKDIHFFHDESYTHYFMKDVKKIDLQFNMDTVLFSKIWNEKIPSIIF